MAATLTLDDVRKAWDARDPRLIKLLEQLVNQPVPRPTTPVRNEALTFDKFLAHLKGYHYRKRSREEQAHYRVETLKALEAPDAEVPLADKLKVHEVIYSLWQSDDPLARDYLLRIIATVPVAYGPWKALKKIFKEAEAKHDTEVYGAISARIDAASAGGSGGHGRVSGATLAYCARRAWRYLRRVAVQLPATYPDVACDYLINYTDSTNWRNTWVFNHVLFHGTKKYGRNRFQFGYRADSDGNPATRLFLKDAEIMAREGGEDDDQGLLHLNLGGGGLYIDPCLPLSVVDPRDPAFAVEQRRHLGELMRALAARHLQTP